MRSGSPSVDTSGAAPSDLLVLIVDDSEKNRKLARDVLRAAGLGTLEAGTAAEAIAVAVERVPDIILLDICLPDMVGTELARQLRGGEETAHIPVIALSALPQAGDCGWLLEAGFAGFLSKPIDVRAFPGQVRGFCDATRI